jgi:periplasmic divalent cation tolerance protein
MVIKSLVSRFEELESWRLEHHPYDIPVIVALPVSHVSVEYRAWIESGVDLLPLHKF